MSWGNPEDDLALADQYVIQWQQELDVMLGYTGFQVCHNLPDPDEDLCNQPTHSFRVIWDPDADPGDVTIAETDRTITDGKLTTTVDITCPDHSDVTGRIVDDRWEW